MSNFAGNVRYFMQLKRMTLADLSEKSGLSKSMICMVLQGQRAPGVKTSERIASGLGITPNTLVTGITPDFLDPVDRELGERELVKEDPKAFASMMQTIKKASEK